MSYASTKDCNTLRATKLKVCRVDATNIQTEQASVGDLYVVNLPILDFSNDNLPMGLFDVYGDDTKASVLQSESLKFESKSVDITVSKVDAETTVTLEVPIRTGTYIPVITSPTATVVLAFGATYSLVDKVMSINGAFIVDYPSTAVDSFVVNVTLPPDYTNIRPSVVLGSCVGFGGGGDGGSKAVCCTKPVGTSSSATVFELTFKTVDRSPFAGGMTGNIVTYSITFAGVYTL